jgi:hypothetical protein
MARQPSFGLGKFEARFFLRRSADCFAVVFLSQTEKSDRIAARMGRAINLAGDIDGSRRFTSLVLTWPL